MKSFKQKLSLRENYQRNNTFKLEEIDYVNETLDAIVGYFSTRTGFDVFRFRVTDEASLIELEKGTIDLDDETLKRCIVVVDFTFEYINNPHKLLASLSRLQHAIPYIFLAITDRVRKRGISNFQAPEGLMQEWSAEEFVNLLRQHNISIENLGEISTRLGGYKDKTLVLFGKDISYHQSLPSVNALAITTVYNEDDIIEQSVNHMLSQGLSVHIIDNWSTDTTPDILRTLAKKHANVTWEKFPREEPKVHVYEWEKLLHRVEEVAKASHNYEWIIHNDADELRESPWEGASITEAIAYVDSLGYNSIDFTVIDFRPTKEGFQRKDNPHDFYKYFELIGSGGYLTQVKAWKNNIEVDLADSAGHHVKIPNQKIYPVKFLSRHYSLRSTAHANKKIFKERKTSFLKSERKKGWHTHYDQYTKEAEFLWKRKYLQLYNESTFKENYFAERISGIGIGVDGGSDV